MDHRLSSPRRLGLLLVALLLGVSSAHGLPVDHDVDVRSDDDDWDDRGEDGWYDYADPPTLDNPTVQPVLLLHYISGLFVHTTKEGLRSDGSSIEDLSAVFVKTLQSDKNSITLMGPDKQLLGITRGGAIVLDQSNSSDIFHVFQIVEVQGSFTQLRVEIDQANCYIAFTKSYTPVENACKLDSLDEQTFLNVVSTSA